MTLSPFLRRLNTHEAASRLGLRPGTLEIWRSLGKGPRYLKIGRRVFYEQEDIEAFAKAHMVETEDSATMARGRHE